MRPFKLLRYAISGWLPGGRCRCVVCGHRVWQFMPYRRGSRGIPPLMRTLGMVGSNADCFECPRCGAHDRERHLLLYLRASGMLETMRSMRVLHFAPEKRLSPLLRSVGLASYLPCDLFPQSADVQRVDMLDMPFAPGSFDMVIANHVLEHVDDDARALAEIHRVLAPAGVAILQTPYSGKLHWTWQDVGIDTAEARLHAYGQEDHVRLIGPDIFDNIVHAGFESCVRTHVELLGDVNPAIAGVNANEPFFLFRKLV
jgi:SAM-dependent methyltransferase